MSMRVRCVSAFTFVYTVCGGFSRASDFGKQDDNVGYLYRFPDLLKRWDDVDGDRGTW